MEDEYLEIRTSAYCLKKLFSNLYCSGFREIAITQMDNDIVVIINVSKINREEDLKHNSKALCQCKMGEEDEN